jgi:tripartite-type tricarboxylate transporter receptor subunit TctC
MRTIARSLAAAAIAALAVGGTAEAQNYPSRPVRLVVPFGPGGVADITARLVTEKMTAAMGQQVIVDNKPGAGGIVAGQAVVSAKPDGYTLLLLNNGTAISASLFKSIPYDTTKAFEPVSAVGFFPVLVLAGKNSPFKGVQDLLAYDKANPGKLNVGTINPGSTQNLTAELFKSVTKANFTIVPFKTTPELVTAISSGEIQVMFEIAAPVLGFITEGTVKPLAVSTGTRFAGLPSVPTVKESGAPNFEVVAWNAVAGPAGMPKEIVDRLNKEILAALAQPDLKKKLQDLGIEARGGTPNEARQLLVSEVAKWGKVIKDANIPQQ